MRWKIVTGVLLSGTSLLSAQDTAQVVPRTAYSAMYARFAADERGALPLLILRWNKWEPRKAAFEGGVGVVRSGPGALLGEAGGVYMVGDRGAVLLLRGGVSLLAIAASEAGVIAPVGAYAGFGLVLGTGHTNLRLEIARHEYTYREDNVGGWMLGVGLTFTPRGPGPKDRGH